MCMPTLALYDVYFDQACMLQSIWYVPGNHILGNADISWSHDLGNVLQSRSETETCAFLCRQSNKGYLYSAIQAVLNHLVDFPCLAGIM